MQEKIGLFLQGGGAKGSFQAGALQAIAEKGLHIESIAGTSIGAINGMILFYNGINRLKELWLKMVSGKYATDLQSPVFETIEAVQRLGEHLGTERNAEIQHYYVNYLKVENGKASHQYTNLVKESDDTIYRLVSASSRLPNPQTWENYNPIIDSFDKSWQEQVAAGNYDGYLMDGGLMNNRFIEPFIENKVDKLYLIVFDAEFEVPESLLQSYQKEQIILIKPRFRFKDADTFNFTVESLEKWYQEGYETTRKLL